MKNTEKKQEHIAEALKAVMKASELLSKCSFSVVDVNDIKPSNTPWSDAEDLVHSMVRDAQVDLAGVMSHLERAHGLLAGKIKFKDESVRYLQEMGEKYGDYDVDFDSDIDHDPLIFPDDVSPQDMELIRKLAKVERKQMDLARKIGAKTVSDLLSLDEVTTKKMDKIMKEGQLLREELLDSMLAYETLDCIDDIEDMKKMAAVLFYLYSTERMRAEREDREPDEDFYYAGTNMYKHSIALQVSEDDDEGIEADWDEDDDDPEEDD